MMVAHGVPCLGPATRTGCGVLCPASGRGCYGCFGPAPSVDVKTVVQALQPIERYPGEARGLFSNISNYAPAFRLAAEKLATQPNQISGEKK
jgi:sulfhydrogenase subunit delta